MKPLWEEGGAGLSWEAPQFQVGVGVRTTESFLRPLLLLKTRPALPPRVVSPAVCFSFHPKVTEVLELHSPHLVLGCLPSFT